MPCPTIAQFAFPRTVRFVDTDASGLAHFSTYVRMMEEAEYAFLRSRGLSVVLYDERGTMGFPRLSASLQIHQPLAYDETASVELMLNEIDGKQITYDFRVVTETGELAVEGRFQVACCRFPDSSPPFAILTPDHVIEALTSNAN